MRLRSILFTLIIICFALISKAQKGSFSINDTAFMLNGKPTVIRCGEMHFARIPKQYWRHRLQMAKAMGAHVIVTAGSDERHHRERRAARSVQAPRCGIPRALSALR